MENKTLSEILRWSSVGSLATVTPFFMYKAANEALDAGRALDSVKQRHISLQHVDTKMERGFLEYDKGQMVTSGLLSGAYFLAAAAIPYVLWRKHKKYKRKAESPD